MVIQAGQFNTASDFGRIQLSASVADDCCVDWELCEGDAKLAVTEFDDLEGPLKESISSASACFFFFRSN